MAIDWNIVGGGVGEHQVCLFTLHQACKRPRFPGITALEAVPIKDPKVA